MLSRDILILLLLTLLNGFFALSEMALVAAKRARLQAAADQGRTGAKFAIVLMEDPTAFLSSIQIGITVIGLVSGIYSANAFAQPLAAVLIDAGLPGRFADKGAYVLVVVLVTYVQLTLGELVPKRVALLHAESLATFVAPVMRVFAILMTPGVWLLRNTVNAILKVLPVSSAPQSAVTEDDVRALVAEGTQAGVFLASERRLLEGVLALADRKVGSIMIPRQDVIWLDIEEPLEVLWPRAKESGHARFLVCREKFDNLLGMITLADLSEALHRGELDAPALISPWSPMNTAKSKASPRRSIFSKPLPVSCRISAAASAPSGFNARTGRFSSTATCPSKSCSSGSGDATWAVATITLWQDSYSRDSGAFPRPATR
jgi:putative hemolysin